MEQYALPRTRIPTRLYRVQYEYSRTQETEFGLTARDTTRFDYNAVDFGVHVAAHISGTSFNSPLISCFAHKDQAEEWMCRRWRSLGEWAQIIEIDTTHLGHGYVYRASRLTQRLHLNVWTDQNHDDILDEYLVLHQINARAIVARRARITVPLSRSPTSSEYEVQYASSMASSRRSSVFEGSDYESSIHSSTECGEPGTGCYARRDSFWGSLPRVTLPGYARAGNESPPRFERRFSNYSFSFGSSSRSSISGVSSASTSRNRTPSTQSSSRMCEDE